MNGTFLVRDHPLYVVDYRNTNYLPEQSTLASITNLTDSTVRWATPFIEASYDLSIIAQLGTLNKSFDIQNIRAPLLIVSGLTRWRVRKQLPENTVFLAESRIGEIPKLLSADSLHALLLNCVDELEHRTREQWEKYTFTKYERYSRCSE